MNIGMIGLGHMGKGMAANLVRAGHTVTAWNRSGGAVEGATMVDRVEDTLQGDLVLSMLTQDDVIEDVIIAPGLLDKARKGLIHVCCATISVDYARKLVDLHDKAGLAYVSAPVLGRPDMAARGELNVLAAGPAAALERAMPALEAIGGRIWPLGDSAPSANAAKIACNMMITMAIEGMAEGAVLAEAVGCSRDTLFELITSTLFAAPVYKVYSALISQGEYTAGFKASLGLKDLRLAKEVAAEALGTSGAALPMLDAVYNRMEETVEAGHADRDWSIMAGYTIDQAQKG